RQGVTDGCDGGIARARRNETSFRIFAPGPKRCAGRKRGNKGRSTQRNRTSDRSLRGIKEQKREIAVVILCFVRAEPCRHSVLPLRTIDLRGGNGPRQTVRLRNCLTAQRNPGGIGRIRPQIYLARSGCAWLRITSGVFIR